jgi:uncharacterized membrane protein required for colicin V production
VNELDYLLIFIVLIGVAVGLRRSFIRVLISIVGMYVTVVVAGYAYQPMGNTLTGAMARVGIEVGSIEAHNFMFLAVVIAMTVAVEVVSRATFEETRIPSLRVVDNLLGGLVGVYYGALWASFFLVPAQYSVARTVGSWTTAIVQSNLAPTLNQVFQGAVLDIVGIFFIDGIPELYHNPFAESEAYLFMNLASVCQVFF